MRKKNEKTTFVFVIIISSKTEKKKQEKVINMCRRKGPKIYLGGPMPFQEGGGGCMCQCPCPCRTAQYGYAPAPSNYGGYNNSMGSIGGGVGPVGGPGQMNSCQVGMGNGMNYMHHHHHHQPSMVYAAPIRCQSGGYVTGCNHNHGYCGMQ